MRDSRAAPGSGEELIEQWDFLDAMIERQATSLRAGRQDPEEEDESSAITVASADADALRSRLTEAETMVAELTPVRERLAALEVEASDLRRRLEDAQHQISEHTSRRAATEQELEARLGELNRLSHSHSELLSALREAHREVETLRLRSPQRRQPSGSARRRWPWGR